MTYASLRSAAQHIARTGTITPHQLAALTRLEETLSDQQRQTFTELWRAEGSPAGPVPSLGANSWEGIYAAAKAIGTRYPELVAAQWALESAHGKAPSGRNNYWGLKGSGTSKATWEVVNGQTVDIVASFLDFDSIAAGVEYLISRWYKDFKGYKGVDRAATREDAARQLVAQGYATDPAYAQKLIALMDQYAPKPKVVTPVQQGKPAPTPAERKRWMTEIKALNLSQPDASTCQAACIGMAVGDRDIAGIRRRLTGRGSAGDPAVMAAVIREYGRPYRYDGNASLAKCYEWLKAGEFLIAHGWFTNSGHVICLDGLKDAGDHYVLDVKDPWSEFNVQTWRYDLGSKFFDGFYSDLLIYATCVASTSAGTAQSAYNRGKVDASRGGMWVHRFLAA